MDKSRKAALISVNKLWEVASEINGILEKYNLYMRMINQGEEEGKVLLTQMLKDLPSWLLRAMETVNDAGRTMAEQHDIRYQPVEPAPVRYRMQGGDDL